jgi:Glycosyltransferase family 87
MSRTALGAALLLAMGWAAILFVDPWADQRINDLFVYRSYAELFLDGVMPYRDVAFEYPPLAAPVIALPGIGGTGEDAYRWAFAALALLLLALLVLLCGRLAARSGGDPRRAMLAAAAAPLLTGAMIRTHFDLLPVVLACAALLALAARRPAVGFGLLGLAAAAKLFPLVAAPPALAWLLARGQPRAAARAVAVLAAVLAIAAGAGLALSPSGFADSFEYHLDRPVQVESSPALTLLALDGLGLGEAASENSFRSDGIRHPASDAVQALFGALVLAAIAAFTVAAARRPTERALLLASLGSIAAFAAFGKVLSPQFLVWTIPLGALAFAWRLHALAATVAAATLLTLAEFPARYFDLVEREPLPLVLVSVRNSLLAVAVVLALRHIAHTGGDPLPTWSSSVTSKPWRSYRTRFRAQLASR